MEAISGEKRPAAACKGDVTKSGYTAMKSLPAHFVRKTFTFAS
jgi:hypothetical protein